MKLTKAEIFKAKVKELKLSALYPALMDIDDTVDSVQGIDEIMFRRSEYLGGMAVVILALIRDVK